MRSLRAVSLVVLVALLAGIITAQTPLFSVLSDKASYLLGEPVSITVGATAPADLRVVFGNQSYSYAGVANGSVPFTPLEAGTYVVEMLSNGSVVAQTSFVVVSEETPSPEQQPIQLAVQTDKAVYA